MADSYGQAFTDKGGAGSLTYDDMQTNAVAYVESVLERIRFRSETAERLKRLIDARTDNS